MSQQSNKKRSDRNFNIGDYVFLKLQPYWQYSLRRQAYHKLVPKYYGPYKVIDRMGNVAYQLELPADSGIHNVFHVSQLKLCTDPSAVAVQHPSSATNLPRGEPECILDRKMVKRGRVAATKVLIKWKGHPKEAATWEFYYDILKDFPNFHS